ncbi:rhomboid-domain-containing protein [Macrolepiota fuliginosa MF-IS2]|uniref:Rhomboid-domain-containing protein n=1 Tax=Macrolepiota fuliginosa MF-IS2 TaxID=1400762 RepID=A0A9P5XI09_9AGAR|nr:rhomboid-domain-containing protein [Macrolepiota fuliginosa MF-IS2]
MISFLRPLLYSRACKPSQIFTPRAFSRNSFPPSRSFFSSSKYGLRYQPPQSRRPSGPFLGFLDNIPTKYVFWGIIGINCTVFFLWKAAAARTKLEHDPSAVVWMYQNFTNSITNLQNGRVWTILTSTFSHYDIGHIFFNMFTFYFMSKHLLNSIGSRQFILLYLGGGVIASCTSMAYSHFVKNRDRPAHGASGAVYSVLAVVACAAPTMSFHLYGILPVPAWLVVSGVFAYDSYNTLKDTSGMTDSVGHVGGLLAGVGYYFARRYRIF